MRLNIFCPGAGCQLSTVSLSAFAYLFSELIQYTLDRAASTTELEDRYVTLSAFKRTVTSSRWPRLNLLPGRLEKVGYEVGTRMLELLSWREKVVRRKPEVLDVLRFIHSSAWPYLFGKVADELQQANAVRANVAGCVQCM